MKTKIILFLILALAGQKGWNQNNLTIKNKCEYKITNVKAITTEDNYSAPIWSPDGNSVMATKDGFTGLYLINLFSNEIKELNNIRGTGYNAVWSNNSKQIYFRNKKLNLDNTSWYEVQSVDVISGKIMVHPEINPDGIQSFIMAENNLSPVVYTNTKTLLIEAQTLDKTKTWIITKDPGQYYQAILSPDKLKVVLHKEGRMFVYSIDGSGLICSLGRGIACSWSSDSKQILYFLGEDDGHQTTGSELYICSADGLCNWQLTYTSNVYEMFPCWSQDNKKIVYSDGKSGSIFVADLIKQ